MYIKKIKTYFLIIIILLMTYKIHTKEILFEDFKSASNTNWKFISDQVMGGVSFGDFKIISEDDISFLRLTGFVSLENNGGFILARKAFHNIIFDDFMGVMLICRGNNNEYYFLIII